MLNITAETTDNEIFALAGHCRVALANAAGDQDGETLVKLAQDVLNAENLALLQIQYRDSTCRKVAPQSKAIFLFNVLANGANDTWSGRNNDSERASFDIIRTWAKYQMSNL